MGIEKTIEIKAIDKEKALKRALNILGVELTDNETVDIIEKVAPRKKFFGLLGTEPGIYEVSIKTKQEEKKEIKEHKEHKPHVHKFEKEKTEKHVKTEKFEKPEKAEKVEKTEKINHSEQEKEILEKVAFFVEKMKLDIKYKIKRVKERVYVVEFFGKDNALIIGQKGKTLNSFEYLLNSMIKNCKIEIDVEKFKEKIEFYNYDVIEFIDNYLKFESTNSFVFLDPPYYNKGSELYTNFYTHEDHKNLANYIKKIKQSWIVTYDNCDEIKEIFKGYNQKEFDISYTLEVKRKSKEIMIFDDKLKKNI